MSSTNPSDPRLLLPEWLRDGDMPAPAAAVETVTTETVETIEPGRNVVRIESVTEIAPATISIEPFSDRLSLDTRLDPGQLVSAADLPKWLGGLERLTPAVTPQAVAATSGTVAPAGGLIAIEEPEPYEGVDSQETGVIDVQVNGWILVAAAIGLLILLLAALRLYLS